MSSTFTESCLSFSGLDPHGLYGSVTHDPLWTPSRKCDFTTPPPVTTSATLAPLSASIVPVTSITTTGSLTSLELSKLVMYIVFELSNELNK